MHGAENRALVESLTESDSDRALTIAREIVDPWYRCQSLSIVAANIADAKTRNKIIQEAFAASHSIGDPNRTVSVSGSPLKVMLVHGELKEFAEEMDNLMDIVSTEPSPIKRLDGIFWMIYPELEPQVQEVLRSKEWPEQCVSKVFDEIKKAAEDGSGLKKRDNILRALLGLTLIRSDKAFASQLALSLEKPIGRAAALIELGEGGLISNTVQEIHGLALVGSYHLGKKTEVLSRAVELLHQLPATEDIVVAAVALIPVLLRYGESQRLDQQLKWLVNVLLAVADPCRRFDYSHRLLAILVPNLEATMLTDGLIQLIDVFQKSSTECPEKKGHRDAQVAKVALLLRSFKPEKSNSIANTIQRPKLRQSVIRQLSTQTSKGQS